MGIWVHPYAVICVQVGVSFRINGVWSSLYDVVVSLLRLQTPIDYIPHPYWMYTKCFSTLRCCRWAYGYTLMPYCYMCRWGGILGKKKVWPSLYDIAVSWLRLQTPIDCIPHPYSMYAKCFSTLRCCGWAYGCTLMPYRYMCRWGGILGKKKVWPSLYDIAVSWLRLQTPIDCIPHPYSMYAKCVIGHGILAGKYLAEYRDSLK